MEYTGLNIDEYENVFALPDDLPFRKLAPNSKRKSVDSSKETNKREKKESQSGGAFEGVPENVFPLGDDVFVVVSVIRGEQYIQIRRYKKYSNTYYPTKEGVLLTPWQFDVLFPMPAPDSADKLVINRGFMLTDFELESVDFRKFTLTRKVTSKSGVQYSRSILLTLIQWNNINDRFEEIMAIVLDFVFRDVDFRSVFEPLADTVISESLPESLDVGAGTNYVTELLYKVICDLLKDQHGLVTPERYDDDIIVESNTVSDFNSASLRLRASEIAIYFRESLWTSQNFLALPPAQYVTVDFLKSIQFDKLIRKAREELCPPCDE